MASESPQLRRRPTRAKLLNSQRDSYAVRASVLETALELGLGQNSAVADWIFNNPLSEDPEDTVPKPNNQIILDPTPALEGVEVMMPALMSSSNSISDETSSLNFPSNNAPSAAVKTMQVSHARKPSVTESPHVHFGDFSSDQLQLISPFDPSFRDVHREETRSNSLGKNSKDAERSRSQDNGLRHQESPSPGLGDSGYASEGQYLSRGKASKAKDKLEKPKANGSKRSDTNKTSEKDGEYLSDGGYLSASSNKSHGKSPGKVKSRAMAFFRRRPKKPPRTSDDEDEDDIPPVPAIPTFPRPSSPKPLERRVTPSSPTRPGFSPLSLNLTSPPTSSPRQRVSKSPPPAQTRATPSQPSDHPPAFQRPPPLVSSAQAPIVFTPAATAATFPLPPSVPSTPLSTASFPTSAPKALTVPSSRQHLNIPPPTPPPTLPLPQPPPSPSPLPNGILPTPPTVLTTPSRRGAPSRPIPVLPLGSTQPLTPRRAASPLRPLLSPRTSSPAILHTSNGESSNVSEGEQPNGKEVTGRQGFGAALSGSGNTPAFLQRRIQQGPPPSPRYPPPDVPLPPSPRLASSKRPRTPIGPPSKFHEHLSSVSSVPLSSVPSVTSSTMSPSPSTTTLSESSSGPSLRSSHLSSISEPSEGPVIRDSSKISGDSRPTTSASAASEVSYGQTVTSVSNRFATDLKSQSSGRSDVSSSIYTPTTHRDDDTSFYDDNDADVDDTTPRSYIDEEDDDASMYPSDDKTAGRRTMYLLEHGELDENGDEIVITGSRFWNGHLVPPPLPPLPPLPSMPVRPGPGYF